MGEFFNAVLLSAFDSISPSSSFSSLVLVKALDVDSPGMAGCAFGGSPVAGATVSVIARDVGLWVDGHGPGVGHDGHRWQLQVLTVLGDPKLLSDRLFPNKTLNGPRRFKASRSAEKRIV